MVVHPTFSFKESATMMDLIVRPFQIADREAWQVLWRKYQAFYNSILSDASVELAWTRLHDPEEPMYGAAAVQAETIVGIVHWLHHRSFWTAGDYAYLQDLFIVESARAQGAGRKLVEHVYSSARRAGCSRVYWLTHESNNTAMKLYDQIAERTGFVQYRKQL